MPVGSSSVTRSVYSWMPCSYICTMLFRHAPSAMNIKLFPQHVCLCTGNTCHVSINTIHYSLFRSVCSCFFVMLFNHNLLINYSKNTTELSLNMMPRRLFKAERDEVTGGCRKEVFRNFSFDECYQDELDVTWSARWGDDKCSQNFGCES
jgi:hypothetical protein